MKCDWETGKLKQSKAKQRMKAHMHAKQKDTNLHPGYTPSSSPTSFPPTIPSHRPSTPPGFLRVLGALIPSSKTSIASILSDVTNLVTQGDSNGCKDNMLDNVIESMAKHQKSAIALQKKRLNEDQNGDDEDEFTRPFVEVLVSS